MSGLLEWLQERLGTREQATKFLYRRLPVGTTWWHTLGSAALVLITPLFFGLAPAIHAASPGLECSLRDGGRAPRAGERQGDGRQARRLLRTQEPETGGGRRPEGGRRCGSRSPVRYARYGCAGRPGCGRSGRRARADFIRLIISCIDVLTIAKI